MKGNLSKQHHAYRYVVFDNKLNSYVYYAESFIPDKYVEQERNQRKMS